MPNSALLRCVLLVPSAWVFPLLLIDILVNVQRGGRKGWLAISVAYPQLIGTLLPRVCLGTGEGSTAPGGEVSLGK